MFSMRNLKNFMFDMSVKHTLSTISKLKELIKTKDEGIDINNILGRFTLDTFCEIAFGQNVGAVESYPKEDIFGLAFDDLVYRTDVRTMDVFWKLKRILNVGNEKFVKKDHNELAKFINDILDKTFMETENTKKLCDVSGIQKYDILTLYLKHNDKLTRTDLHDVALNFIIAGRDTTRMLLSWFFYELCTNKDKDEIFSCLMDEINVFSHGNEPKYDDFVNGFGYLE
eukprot:UN05480